MWLMQNHKYSKNAACCFWSWSLQFKSMGLQVGCEVLQFQVLYEETARLFRELCFWIGVFEYIVEMKKLFFKPFISIVSLSILLINSKLWNYEKYIVRTNLKVLKAIIEILFQEVILLYKSFRSWYFLLFPSAIINRTPNWIILRIRLRIDTIIVLSSSSRHRG